MTTAVMRSSQFRLALFVLATMALPLVAESADATVSGVARAEARLADATSARERAEDEVERSQRELADVESRLSGLNGESANLARQISDLRAEVRQQLIRAFVSSGATEQAALLATIDNTQDLSRGQALLEGTSARASDSADELGDIRARTAEDILAVADQFEELRTRLDNARSDLMQAEALEADAERRLVQARSSAAAAERRARVASAPQSSVASTPQRSSTTAAGPGAQVTETTASPANPPAPSTSSPTPTTPAPSTTVAPPPPPPTTIPSEPGMPTEAQWLRLRQCESGNNYRAVSPSGKYRGAYQFSQGTWESLGGQGDPAAASPAEQDARAKALYRARGAKPWPHCGRHLKS